MGNIGSEMELEILNAIRKGYSNEEIVAATECSLDEVASIRKSSEVKESEEK